MNEKIIYFDDLEKDIWNKEIKKLQGNRDLCSWNLIKYYMSFNGMVNKSFLYYFERNPRRAFQTQFLAQISLKYDKMPKIPKNDKLTMFLLLLCRGRRRLSGLF